MSSGNKKKPDEIESVNTKIYARVRQLMPWEPKKVSLSVEGKKVRNKAGKIVNEYDFDQVFKPSIENDEVFNTIVMPMVSNVLKGFNAVLIAYGQTGSGKTFSMLGKPKLGIVGLLPMMLEYFVKTKSVSKVELSSVEAFGWHVSRIELFDLYDPENQTPVWGDKNGNTSLDMSKARTVEIHDAQDAHDKIVYAHAASHFAPTGKNPESSRGHVTFVAKITQKKNEYESLTSYFVMVDCAGSEGESAFTPDFVAKVDKATLMARRLEAGCINTGLSALQVIFNQLRTKGVLSDTIGNGLRRVLKPYINTRTYLSVLFTLSPSINNSKSTESTLKFAVTAGMVKVKPVAMAGKVNFEKLVKELREHIAKQEKIIEENNTVIEDIERQIEKYKQAALNTPKNTKNMKVELPSNNLNNQTESPKWISKSPRLDENVLDALDVLDDAEKDLLEALGETPLPKSNENESDKPVTGRRGRTVTCEENDEAMKVAMNQWKEQLKVQKKPPPPRKSGLATKPLLDVAKDKDKDKDKDKKRSSLLKPEVERKQDYTRLKEAHQKLHEKEEKEEIKPEELKSFALEITTLLETEKAVNEGLKLSQQVISDYLKEEGREALLAFFKIRKGVKWNQKKLP